MLGAKPVAESGPIFRPDRAGSIVETPRTEKVDGCFELWRRSPQKDNRFARHDLADWQVLQLLAVHRRVGRAAAFAAYRRVVIFPGRIDQRDGPFSPGSDEPRQDRSDVFPPPRWSCRMNRASPAFDQAEALLAIDFSLRRAQIALRANLADKVLEELRRLPDDARRHIDGDPASFHQRKKLPALAPHLHRVSNKPLIDAQKLRDFRLFEDRGIYRSSWRMLVRAMKGCHKLSRECGGLARRQVAPPDVPRDHQAEPFFWRFFDRLETRRDLRETTGSETIPAVEGAALRRE